MGIASAVNGQRVYLDTNIFVYALESYPRFIPVITELFALIDRREVFAVTSELTLAEVLVKPLRDKNVALAQTYQQLLQASHAFDIIPITRPIILDAAQRRSNQSPCWPRCIGSIGVHLDQVAGFWSRRILIEARSRGKTKQVIYFYF